MTDRRCILARTIGRRDEPRGRRAMPTGSASLGGGNRRLPRVATTNEDENKAPLAIFIELTVLRKFRKFRSILIGRKRTLGCIFVRRRILIELKTFLRVCTV